MASLDQVLDRMKERGAERLVLRVGAIPAVRASGRDVPVQKVPLSEGQVLSLVRELADHDTALRIDRREPATFSYRGFEVRLVFTASGAAVDVAPEDAFPSLDVGEPVPALVTTEPPSPAPHRGGFAFDEPDDQAVPIDIDRSAAPERRATGRSLPPAAGEGAAIVGVRLPSLPPATGVGVAPSTLAPPGGFLEDLRGLLETRASRYVAVGALGVLGLSVLGGALWCTRPARLPNVVLADSSGRPVTFQDIRGNKPRLLLVFMLPGCSMSRFATDTLKEAYPARSERIAFAGLFFGTQAQAEQHAKEQQVPFPVYGLKDTKDPFKIQDLMKRVGTSDWMASGVYGGTTLVLDDENRVELKLEKEGVRHLPEKLAALRD